MTRLLTSRRTELRPFAAADAGEILRVFRDADVRRYLLDDKLVSAEWVDDEIAASDERFERIGAGLWSIRLAGAPAIIGFTGFREFFDPPQLQLLYALLPAHWGRGLATEAAARVCQHAFEDLAFAEISAAIDVPNNASAEVLERLGMRHRRTTAEGVSGTAFFSLSRADWLAQRTARH